MVESEHHVLRKCPLYEDLQHEMYSHAFNINPGFYYLSGEEKIRFLFSSKEMIKTVAKSCKDSLDRRRRFLYNNDFFLSSLNLIVSRNSFRVASVLLYYAYIFVFYVRT